MDGPEKRLFKNQLLAALPDDAMARLTAAMEPVALPVGMILEQAGQSIQHVYFPESGIASVVALIDGGGKMEAGPFGWDGMSGIAIVQQVDTSPLQTLVQVGGAGHRVPASLVAMLMEESPQARRLFLHYAYAFSLQAVYTALAASVAVLEHRLARWLLMLHDRVEGDEIRLTHDFMSMMLAVRRPGVTVALHQLEGRALIRSYRGRVLIRDREGLMELCDGIYGAPEAAYRRLILDPEGR